MREYISIRINDHQEVNGTKEYAIEVSVPGTYHNIIVGASQEEIVSQATEAFTQILTLVGIPEKVVRKVIVEAAIIDDPHSSRVTDTVGNQIPGSGFAAIAKATFDAQVIRDGKVVTDGE